VPRKGIEPPHLAAAGPKPAASTNFATWALPTLAPGLFAALSATRSRQQRHCSVDQWLF
jgi:hypothetical protein